MENEEIERKSKVRYIGLVFFIITLLTSGFLIYEIFLLSGIETLIRYIIMGVLAFIDIIFYFKTKNLFKYKVRKKNKRGKAKSVVLITFMVFYSIICALAGGTIFYIYGKLSNMNKVYVTYSSSLITKSDNGVDSVSDIDDYTIGILDDKKSPEGYIIPQEIIKENNLKDNNKIKKYNDYSSMLADLYSGDIDSIFISSNYVSMFSTTTGYENIEKDTKVITSKEKRMKKSDVSKNEGASSGKSVKEPFTILLMGIDSTDDVLTKNAVANGDTLILITFNPKTLNATMLSIPRDSYVPIACWSDKAQNKITHAAGYGTDCMMNTIEEYFDVDIDYYAKINFKGLVKLVNAVGGIDVDVPKKLCTDDSSRKKEICINKGHQHLNGEQALVYARNRKQLANGDFGRAEHQQEIIKALMNKIKTVKDISKFTKILDTVSDNMDTNLTTKQILSFYNVGKDIIKKSLVADDSDIVDIQQLYLSGTGQMIYDKRSRLTLWNYVPYIGSKKEIIEAMKVNLEKKKHKTIKKFSFSINNTYEKKVIGKGTYTKTEKFSNQSRPTPSFSKSTTRSYNNNTTRNNTNNNSTVNNNNNSAAEKNNNNAVGNSGPISGGDNGQSSEITHDDNQN
ncbi:MAG: LCP family protein [Bacilli bacterium]|nr:LCP family protein [Bacilli bacterium]